LQASELDDPTVAEYLPAPQSAHEVVVTEYFPASQLVHAALPLTTLYVPATQAKHVPPFVPVNPTLQVQAPLPTLETGAFASEGHATHVDEALAPTAAEYVAAPQSVQASLPVVVLYLPATHAAHDPPFGPVNPALQAQAVPVVLELGAFEFEGHDKQVDAALAPILFEYVLTGHSRQVLACVKEYWPAPQSVQAALPVTDLNLPGVQAVQTPTTAPEKPVSQKQSAIDALPLDELEPTGHDTQGPEMELYCPALHFPKTVHVISNPVSPVLDTAFWAPNHVIVMALYGVP